MTIEQKICKIEQALCSNKVLFYTTKSKFPTTGNVNNFYINLQESAIYIWNGTDYELFLNPLIIGDTASIDLQGAGTTASPLTAVVKISGEVGNILELNTDGLFVPAPSSYTLNIQDTSSVDLGGDGTLATPLTATVKISAEVGNTLETNVDGLFVPTPASFTLNTQDTSTVDLGGDGTIGTPLTANVKVSAEVGNTIETNVDGLFVPPVVIPSTRFGFAGEDAVAAETRNFNVNGNPFSISDGVNTQFLIDNVNNICALGDYTNYIKPVITAEVVAGGPITSQYTQNAAGTLVAYQETGVVNGTTQPRFLAQLTGAAVNSEIRLIEDKFNISFDSGLTTDPYLLLDYSTDNYAIGDYANFVKPVIGLYYAPAGGKGAYVNVIDADFTQEAIAIFDTGAGAQYPQIAFSVDDSGNSALFDIQQNVIIGSFQGNTQRKLMLDRTNNAYTFGDIDAIVNGSRIQVDDANNVFRIRNTANNIGIQINGIAGFTGTVTPVNSITVNNGIVTAVS